MTLPLKFTLQLPGTSHMGPLTRTMDKTAQEIPLGRTVSYPTRYDAALLFPIERADARRLLGHQGPGLPFIGWDLWNAYEMSWLGPTGLPRVAIVRVRVPCDSPRIIESKSFKLYLNGFNQTRFGSAQEVLSRLHEDLGRAAGAPLEVTLVDAGALHAESIREFNGLNLDLNDHVEIDTYEPDAGILSLAGDGDIVRESVYSRLLKSNCPVTGQPDWACIQIEYAGARIHHESLLRYIVSFRLHSGFHEHCVERIFTDIMAACRPDALSVFARYTRRGGLDISPWRATPGMPAPAIARSARQ